MDSLSDASSLFDFLEHYPSAFEMLWNALSKAPYLAELLTRNPEDFYWLIGEAALGKTIDQTELKHQFEATVFPFDSPYRRYSFLHRLHRRHFLRIATRDLMDIASFEQTTRELSDLAETLVQIVTQMVLEKFAEKDSLPDTRFTVIALGKLGGQELNYSSDIDLMFIYEKDGELPNGETYSTVFQRIAEEICRILNEQSEHGMLYRVDTRLRPDGTSGILCQSLSAYLHYYAIRGRLWERQMLLKARSIAGSIVFGRKVLAEFEPFIFPKTIQYPLHEIVGLRKKSETQTPQGINVKSDPGGIRDIEFIVQAIQLQFGGQQREIRSGNTLQSLKKMANEDEYLNEEESVTLQEAYRFLRKIEHSLQLQENRQIHELPDTEPDNLLITSALNFGDYDSMYRKTAETIQVVRKIFKSIFQGSEVKESESFSKFTEEDWINYFRNRGFATPDKAARQVQALATGRFPNNHDSQTRHAFWEMCPALLDTIHDMPMPAQALTDFERIVRSYNAIGSVYSILGANPELLQMVLTLILKTPKIVPWIIQQPELFDSLLSSSPDPISEDQCKAVYEPLGQSEASFEEWKKDAMQVHHDLLLTIFIQWVTNAIDLTQVQYLFAKAYRHFLRMSLDYWLAAHRNNLSVILAGSAAADSMHFSSDIDVIFLIAPDTNYVQVQKSVEAYIAAMQEYTVYGRLLSFDFRLRPEGRSSPLIMPLHDYHNYINNRMSGWEFQAMQKAMHIWGNASVWESASTTIQAIIDERSSSVSFRQELIDWEQSVIAQKYSGKSRNLSYQAGGYFTVRNSLEWKNLVDIRDDQLDFGTLSRIFQFYQEVRWHLSLIVEGSISRLPNDEQKRRHLAYNMDFENASALKNRLDAFIEAAERINKEFRRILLKEVS